MSTEAQDLPGSSWIDWPLFRAVAEECDWTPLELRDLYVDGTRELQAGIRAAVAASDAGEMLRLAHSCVGSSSTCGIPGMAELYRSMEDAARDGRLEEYAELAELAEGRLEAVARALGERLAPG